MNTPDQPIQPQPADQPGEELWQLVAAFCDGLLTEPQRDRLEAILAQDPAARKFCVAYLDLHASILWRFREADAAPAEDAAADEPSAAELPEIPTAPIADTVSPVPAVRRRFFSPMQLAGAISVCAVVFVAYMFTITWGMFDERPGAGSGQWAVGGEQWSEEAGQVAKITASEDAQWRSPEDADAANPPSSILHSPSSIAAAQPLALTSGIVTLELKKGVKLVVQGPARWKIDGDNRATLTHGKLIATVPHEAIGFTVKTPTTEIVDLGTEFGVTVDDKGETRTHVFRREIRVEQPRLKATTVSAGKSIRLTAGQAVQVDRGGKTTFIEPLARTPAEFIRPPGATAEDNFNPDQLSPYAKYVIDETKPVAYWDFCWYRDSMKIVNDRIASHPFEQFLPRNAGVLGPGAKVDGYAGFGITNPALEFDQRQAGGHLTLPIHASSNAAPDRKAIRGLSVQSYSVQFWFQSSIGFDEQILHYLWSLGVDRDVDDGLLVSGTYYSTISAPNFPKANNIGRLVYFGCNDDGQVRFGPTILQPHRWYCVAFVRSQEQVSIYLNGQLEIESSLSWAKRADNLMTFGQRTGQLPTAGWQGQLDEVAIWDRSLGPEEVTAIYEQSTKKRREVKPPE